MNPGYYQCGYLLLSMIEKKRGPPRKTPPRAAASSPDGYRGIIKGQVYDLLPIHILSYIYMSYVLMCAHEYHFLK